MNLLYRVSIRKRMSIILVTFTIPIMLLMSQLYNSMHKQVDFTKAEINGIIYIKPLLGLLDEVADFQITNILTQNGDKEAEKDIAESEAEISKIIEDLNKIHGEIGNSLKVTDRNEVTPSILKAKWEKIKKEKLNSELYNSFLNDNLSLIAYVTDKSNLILDPELDTYYLMDAATTSLPAMLREIAKLKYLISTNLIENNTIISTKEKARTLLEAGLLRDIHLPKVLNSISTAIENDANNNGVNPTLIESLRDKTASYKVANENLITTIENLASGASMSASEFIAIADIAHDDSATLAKLAIIELDKMLEVRNAALIKDEYIIMGICLFSVIASYLLFILISGSITNSVKNLHHTMEDMIKGKLDLLVPGQEHHDEIGAMAKCVENFRQNGLEKVKLEADNIEKDKRAKEDKIKTAHNMAASFEARVKGVIQTVASASTELYHTAQSMTKLMEDTGKKVQSVKGNSERTSQNVNTVASAAEEMSASIKEVASQVLKSSSAVQASVLEVDKTDKNSSMLEKSASKIGNVLQLIQDISEQINLLALNATIEAARAGDAGKGFAVVASEVKNLASQTTKATEEIAQYVSSIQDSSHNVIDGLQLIKRSISDVEQYSTAISTAVEEQSSATREIAANMSGAAAGSSQITGDIVDVSRATNDAGTASDQVLQAAKMLSLESEKLNGEVEKFLAEIRNG